jgi:hypothetical protein
MVDPSLAASQSGIPSAEELESAGDQTLTLTSASVTEGSSEPNSTSVTNPCATTEDAPGPVAAPNQAPTDQQVGVLSSACRRFIGMRRGLLTS